MVNFTHPFGWATMPIYSATHYSRSCSGRVFVNEISIEINRFWVRQIALLMSEPHQSREVLPGMKGWCLQARENPNSRGSSDFVHPHSAPETLRTQPQLFLRPPDFRLLPLDLGLAKISQWHKLFLCHSIGSTWLEDPNKPLSIQRQGPCRLAWFWADSKAPCYLPERIPIR